jgi:GNAT superfamily N-acetyltransferase
MKSVTLRSATINDCKTILTLIEQLAEFEKLSNEVVATEESLRETLFHPEFSPKIILAEQEGMAVGFALYFYNYSTFLARPGIYLEDLFVIPEQRNQGIGLQLLSAIAKEAIKLNCGRIEWSVLKWNMHAKRFYERLGAGPQTEWEVYRLTGNSIQNLANKR